MAASRVTCYNIVAWCVDLNICAWANFLQQHRTKPPTHTIFWDWYYFPLNLNNQIYYGKLVMPSLKLTWHLKMVVSNRNLLFQGSILRGHVSFREGKYTNPHGNPSCKPVNLQNFTENRLQENLDEKFWVSGHATPFRRSGQVCDKVGRWWNLPWTMILLMEKIRKKPPGIFKRKSNGILVQNF